MVRLKEKILTTTNPTDKIVLTNKLQTTVLSEKFNIYFSSSRAILEVCIQWQKFY